MRPITADPARDRVVAETPWLRLSPIMLAVHPVQELIRLAPALVGVLILGRNGSGYLWGLIGLGLAIVLGLARWMTTTYQITETRVQVRRGLLRRQVLTVPRDRIRSVDLTARAFHRVLGLQRVAIGTGRSDKRDDGVTLDALSAAAAAELRVHLLSARAPGDRAAAHLGPDLADTGEVVAALDPRWLRFGPFTLTGLATVGVVAASLARIFDADNKDPGRSRVIRQAAEYLATLPWPLLVLGLVAAVVCTVAVLSTLGYVLAFWNFRLTRHPQGTLHVRRGLITTRSITIEQRRVRGAEISEPLLLRMVGGARCLAITTGLRVGRGAEHGGYLLLPPAPLAEATRVAGTIVGDPDPFARTLVRHGRGARARRHVRAALAVTIIAAALAALSWLADWPMWTWQAGLLLYGLGALVAEDRYRNLGHARWRDGLVIRQGSIVRRRYVLTNAGIVGWTLRESFFQRRRGLATLVATTAAGRQHYDVIDIDAETAVTLADDLLPGLLTGFLVPGSGRPLAATVSPAGPRESR